MNIQLGRGGKVHYAGEPDGYMPTPKCGGNRAAEGYHAVKAEVDCKNCLKIMAAEAEAEAQVEEKGETTVTVTEAPANPEYDAAFERGRARGMDHAESHDFAAEAVRNARIRAEQSAEKLAYRTVHPVTGKRIIVKVPRAAKWVAWEGGEVFGFANVETEAEAVSTLPKGREFTVTALSPISPRIPAESAIIATDVPVDAGTATTEGNTEMPPRAKKTVAKKTAAAPKATAEATTNVGLALWGDDPQRPTRELWERVSTADVETFRTDARRVLGDASEVSGADLDGANWDELFEHIKGLRADAPADTSTPGAAEELADAIQRAKDIIAQVLSAAEVGEAADPARIKELAESAEAIITELPVDRRTELRAALEEAKRGESYTAPGHSVKAGGKKTASKAVAKKTAKAVATKETQDYKSAIPEAEAVVADIAQTYASGVEAEKANANAARTIAEKVLAARLFLTDKDGHPDFNGKSHAAKTISGDIYAAAGEGFERTEENEDALDRLVKAVQNIRQDVLVKYVRNISVEDAQKFFPLALKADPKADPTEAIQKFYKIPTVSTWETAAERQRLARAAAKALRAGDEAKAKELEAAAKAVGKEPSAEGGEGEGAAAAPTTAADKRKAKHLSAIETATEKLAGIEEELEKIGKEEAADLIAKLEAFSGMTATLTAMLKAKTS